MLFVLLQAGEVDPVVGTAVDRILGLGFAGLAALVFGYLWWKERARASKAREAENLRLIKEKEHSDVKVNVLYQEIKEALKGETEKYVEIVKKQNEIHEKTVEALMHNSEVIQDYTHLSSKHMETLDKHAASYEQFISVLLSKLG